jgi:hypothetical protein
MGYLRRPSQRVFMYLGPFLLPGIAVDPRPTQRDIARCRGSAFAVVQNAYTGLRWAVGHARVKGGPPLFRAG